jgi:hypothetical protein
MQSRHRTVSITFFVYACRGTSSIVSAGDTGRARAILPPMPARDIAAFLRQRSVFAGLPAREIDAVAALTVEETHRARSYIFLTDLERLDELAEGDTD